ncbi:MAG: transposase [Rhodococcus sp.]|nr:transposase [Rhodococcus sp. (in: high G+C Gram-positive bacteria)]
MRDRSPQRGQDPRLRSARFTAFAHPAAFAIYTGIAPIEASSGNVVRYRLSRAGDRQLNCVLPHHGHHRDRSRNTRTRVLPTKASLGKASQGSVALFEEAALGRLLPAAFPRLGDRAGGRPGKTLGGGSIVLRGRLTPRTPALRTSHFPNPPHSTYNPGLQVRLDAERCRLGDTSLVEHSMSVATGIRTA